jgi:hypothetical protein
MGPTHRKTHRARKQLPSRSHVWFPSVGRVLSEPARRVGVTSAVDAREPERTFRREGGEMPTSKKDASAASKQLMNPKSTKAQKSVAASDLSQAKGKGKK